MGTLAAKTEVGLERSNAGLAHLGPEPTGSGRS